MTSSQGPQQPEPEEAPYEEPAPESQPARPQRQPRPRRQRPEQNPALDPRLAQLESRSRQPSKAGDVSLMAIALVAFVFGVAMHFWVATAVLDGGGESAASSNVPEATMTPDTAAPTVTATVEAQPTATPLPDRTDCDAIRDTQYRSVTEREFFLENCTGGQ